MTMSLQIVFRGAGIGSGLAINALPLLDAITPLSGSIYGGQVVTITGSTFHADDTTVTLSGNACMVTFVDETTVSGLIQ